jgi:isopenicillin N synthase-like dioxygenase
MATTTIAPPSETANEYISFHAVNGEARRPILTGNQMKKTFESIPQINFDRIDGSLDERKQLAKEVGAAFKDSGFLYACNHGIPKELTAQVLQAMKHFFNLPTEEKMKIHIDKSLEIKGYEALLETKLDTTTRGGL